MRLAVFSIFLLLSKLLLEGHFYQPNLTINVKMRDGLELPTDIYLPKNEHFSAILIRSPSGRKTPYALMYSYLVDHGFSVIIQDTRSYVDEEGKTLPYSSDGNGELKDGYDTVAWLKESPYSNGIIGTIGTSSMGITQLFLAPTTPAGLKCQYICLAAPDLFNHGIFHSGKFLEHQTKLWLKKYAKHPICYDTIFSQSSPSPFRDSFNPLLLSGNVTIPAIHFGGWYDVFLKGTIDSFVTWQNKGGSEAKGKQKLIIGPWIHLWPFVTRFGDFNYPEEAYSPPVSFKPEDWFSYHLKGEKNSIENLPAVTYFLMGPFDGTTSSGNVWKSAEHWPPSAEYIPLYLSHKNDLTKDGPNEMKYNFIYNPENPVPTLGGRNLFLISGPIDQQCLECRDDMVTFSTKPLEEDLEVTGELLAKIYFSTDQDDTDLSVRLSDVYPDGKSVLIADGIARLSEIYNKDLGEKIRNTIIPITIDLWPTSFVFAKGHSIRLAVTSSNYPKYEKSLNTLFRSKEASKIAKNSIYTGQQYPSHILLPIIKNEQIR